MERAWLKIFGRDRFFVGRGPFTSAADRIKDRPAFYVQDFFLEDPQPWKHPATWAELDAEAFARELGAAPSPKLGWTPPEADHFVKIFVDLRRHLDAGDWSKAVPVIFESGIYEGALDDLVAYLGCRAAQAVPGLIPYAFANAVDALVGLTPEILFHSERPKELRTMALAGTAPIAEAEELARRSKDVGEHAFVVRDISERLAPYGRVEVGATELFRLRNLAHLKSEIRLQLTTDLTFEDRVEILHPTAALGVFPRLPTAQRWLADQGRAENRSRYGAPFGVEWPDGRASCVVAIRNIEAHANGKLRIGSGCGVVRESDAALEWDELTLKRESVKRNFGLGIL